MEEGEGGVKGEGQLGCSICRYLVSTCCIDTGYAAIRDRAMSMDVRWC